MGTDDLSDTKMTASLQRPPSVRPEICLQLLHSSCRTFWVLFSEGYSVSILFFNKMAVLSDKQINNHLEAAFLRGNQHSEQKLHSKLEGFKS